MAGSVAQMLRWNCRVGGLQLIRAARDKTLTLPALSTLRLPVSVQTAYSSTDAAKHNHTRHWTAERGLTVGLMGIIPAALAFPHPIMDCALAFSLTMHATWGMEAIVQDYIRPSIFGTFIPKVAMGALYALSILAFASLCLFNYNDIGIANAIRALWAL